MTWKGWCIINLLNSSTISSILLSGARARNAEAWGQILARFNPKILDWIRRANVAKADEPDLIQDVWRSVLASLHHFHRQDQGDSFGGWLRTITQRRTIDYLQRRTHDRAISAMMIEEASRRPVKSDDDSVHFNSNQNRQLAIACEKVKEAVNASTWQAFEMYVIEDKPVEEVMAALNIAEHTVYTAKSRVLRRLRALMAE